MAGRMLHPSNVRFIYGSVRGPLSLHPWGQRFLPEILPPPSAAEIPLTVGSDLWTHSYASFHKVASRGLAEGSLPQPGQLLVPDRSRLHSAGLNSETENGSPLHLSDAKELFKQLATKELASALLNLELVARDSLVAVGTRVLQSPLMHFPPTAVPILSVLRHTAYAHFCAGGTVEEAAATLSRNWSLGLKGILDYSVEEALDDGACTRNLDGFLRTIRVRRQLPDKAVSFACVKLTAICPAGILSRSSDLLRWHHFRDPSLPLPWLRPSLPVLAPESPPPPAAAAPPPPLSAAEEAALGASLERLRAICQASREEGLPLLVDAEWQAVQPAIDHLTFCAAVEFNAPGAPPLVYGTVQAYLKDAVPRLEAALGGAERAGVPLGLKLVRGAYLTREAAAAGGVATPVHASIEDTHAAYDRCAAIMLEAAGRGGPRAPGLVLATHNIASGRAAAARALQVGLSRASPLLHFAQLKGMADSLSLGLAHAGFLVSKYLPFGPITEVLPYLLRRAEENRGLLGNTMTDRNHLRRELWRRIFRRAS